MGKKKKKKDHREDTPLHTPRFKSALLLHSGESLSVKCVKPDQCSLMENTSIFATEKKVSDGGRGGTQRVPGG